MIDPEKLRKAREAKGLNASQLAIQAGLARNVVHRLEDGSRGASVRTVTLARLANVLGVTIDDLIRDELPAKDTPEPAPVEEAPQEEPNPEAWRWG